MASGIPKNGKPNSSWFKKGHRVLQKWKESWSKKNKKKWQNPGYKKHMSNVHKGQVPWNKGKRGLYKFPYKKKLTAEWKRKIGEKHKGRPLSEEHKRKIGDSQRGEKSYLWRGGISYEPYTIDWTNTLKRSIKERDHYMCYLCKTQEDLVIHHIDYNKKNCNPNNLITLCRGCHTKTNHNRNHWKTIF